VDSTNSVDIGIAGNIVFKDPTTMLLIRLLISYPKYLILLVGLVIAIWGSVEIMNTTSTPSAQTLTMAQFESQRPSSGWYHVTGAIMGLGGAMGVNSSDHKAAEGETPVAIIAPVWSATDRNGTKLSIFVKTSNPALLAAAHPKAAPQTVDFSGLIEASDPNDNTIASEMAREGGDVVVLDDGSAPTPIALGVLIVVAGLAITAGGIVLFVKKIPLWGRHGAAAYQAPRTGGYAPQQFPQQGGYPPQQGNYPGYPPQQGNYPGYPSQPGNYPPQGQGGEPPAGPTMGSLPPLQ
jgi:hypothetical protein